MGQPQQWEVRQKFILAGDRKSCSGTQICRGHPRPVSSTFFFPRYIFPLTSNWPTSAINAERNCCERWTSLRPWCFGLRSISGCYCLTFKWIWPNHSIRQSDVLSNTRDGWQPQTRLDQIQSLRWHDPRVPSKSRGRRKIWNKSRRMPLRAAPLFLQITLLPEEHFLRPPVSRDISLGQRGGGV